MSRFKLHSPRARRPHFPAAVLADGVHPLLPVTVAVRDEQPCLINWAGQTYYGQRVLKTWTEERQRWLKKERFECFLVQVDEGELELCRIGSSWYLRSAFIETDGGEIVRNGALETCKPYRINRVV